MATAVLAAVGLWLAYNGFADCNGLVGPVVTAAKKAPGTGDVNVVLIWVQAAVGFGTGCVSQIWHKTDSESSTTE